ncbi:4-coumarate-CoA ligase-like protein [Mycena venus]|uniref:4-coumarate-CoA ligase-like protein n=1 Tax=Mycena venus TaxID=2733690 RepID=A0A8H6WS83_9AGAR|nr:4-coumarate-CoA ligase-like protein [Mycena venus]
MVAAAYLVGLDLRQHWEAEGKWDYRTLAHLPTAHIAGVKGYFVSSFWQGGTVYWMSKFDFVQFLEFNRSLKITNILSVPPIYLLCTKSPLVEDHFRSLKSALAGAAPLGKELQIEVGKKLGVFLAQTWGLSETTGSVSGGEVNVEDLTGSVGPLLANVELRHVHPFQNNRRGRERLLSRHTWGGSCERANSYEGETLAFFKEDRLFIVDRKKELIKYKGLQVAPAELEAVLTSHQHILDAGVIGVFDEQQSTEVPRAYVVADKSVISAKAIQDFVKSRLASHKQLRGGVEFVAAIPKSLAGKILRKDLRALAMATSPAKAKL